MTFESNTNWVTVVKSVGAAREETGRRLEDGIRKCCEMILAKSQEYVPRDTNALALTGHVEVVGKGLGTWGFVGYGGASVLGKYVDYAIYVHEDTTKFHEPPTKAKFVEDAVKELRGALGNVMKRALKIGRL